MSGGNQPVGYAQYTKRYASNMSWWITRTAILTFTVVLSDKVVFPDWISLTEFVQCTKQKEISHILDLFVNLKYI